MKRSCYEPGDATMKRYLRTLSGWDLRAAAERANIEQSTRADELKLLYDTEGGVPYSNRQLIDGVRALVTASQSTISAVADLNDHAKQLEVTAKNHTKELRIKSHQITELKQNNERLENEVNRLNKDVKAVRRLAAIGAQNNERLENEVNRLTNEVSAVRRMAEIGALVPEAKLEQYKWCLDVSGWREGTDGRMEGSPAIDFKPKLKTKI